jgi:hypothetical protein
MAVLTLGITDYRSDLNPSVPSNGLQPSERLDIMRGMLSVFD